jgi:hypothetical protein
MSGEIGKVMTLEAVVEAPATESVPMLYFLKTGMS